MLANFHYLLYTESTLFQTGHPYVYRSRDTCQTCHSHLSLFIISRSTKCLLKPPFNKTVNPILAYLALGQNSIKPPNSKPKHCGNKMQNILPV